MTAQTLTLYSRYVCDYASKLRGDFFFIATVLIGKQTQKAKKKANKGGILLAIFIFLFVIADGPLAKDCTLDHTFGTIHTALSGSS